jgi:hypothetical protein
LRVRVGVELLTKHLPNMLPKWLISFPHKS